jgi:hypothetical protein
VLCVPGAKDFLGVEQTAVILLELTIPDRLSSLRRKGKKLVAVKNIKLGQVWRQDASGQDYLVTKVYSEVFTQYAVLRPAEVTAPDAPTVKVKVTKSGEGVTLPGFSFTQEGAF